MDTRDVYAHLVYLYIRFNTQLLLALYTLSPSLNRTTHAKTRTYATANPPLGTGRLYWFIPRFVRSPLIAWQPPPVTCHRHSRRRRAAIVFVVAVHYGPFIFWSHAIFLSATHALVRLIYATPGGGAGGDPRLTKTVRRRILPKVRFGTRKMRGRVSTTFGMRAFYVMTCIVVAVLGVRGTDDSLRSALEAISDKLGSTPPRVGAAVYLNTGWYPARQGSDQCVRTVNNLLYNGIARDLMQFSRYII